jgi:GNAT superfamily N-acetyltransferase
VRYYSAAAMAEQPGAPVRRITFDDAEATDLSPCGLSPTALRGWLRRGWRMFGIVRDGALLCHALAAYPLADTEEVSAVFTAPAARRRGLAAAVVAATAADILRRGRRPIYVTTRSNRASRRVAEGLGFGLIGEWWEVVT